MALSFSKDDIAFIKNLMIEAGELCAAIQKRGVTVRKKKDSTIITEADIQVQEMLVRGIERRFPEMKFIHEENQEKNYRDVREDTWLAVIDPLDGTAVYSMGLPTWSISIGFFFGFEPKYGFVFSPPSNLFYHNDDIAAYRNGLQIAVDPEMNIDSESNLFVTAEIFRSYHVSFPGKVRNLGSTALHGCLVADNAITRTIAYIGRSYLWDWGGVIPIVVRAGGSLRYLSGKTLDIQQIIANGCSLPEYCIAHSVNIFEEIRGFLQSIPL
jgi:myo-inositol-1(or 4)-monophosphatase